MPLQLNPRLTHPVGAGQEGQLQQLGLASTSQTKEMQEAEVQRLIQHLHSNLPGYAVNADTHQTRRDGFVRVYIQAPWENSPSTIWDLQVGGPTPQGSSVHISTGKMQTYGSVGASLWNDKMVSTFDNVVRLVKGVYDSATKTGKPPQDLIWTTYQEGNPGVGLAPFGGVITPSTSSAQVGQIEKEIPVGWSSPSQNWQETQAREYGIKKNIITRKPGFTGLGGYIWKNGRLIPAAQNVMDAREGVPPQVEVVRGTSQAKSPTANLGARGIAEGAVIRDPFTGELREVRPNNIYYGGGRKAPLGYTESNMILPGETRPRRGFVQRTLLADQSVYFGGALVGPEAFTQEVADPQTGAIVRAPLTAGERMVRRGDFNPQNIQELEEIIGAGKKGIKFYDLEGSTIRPGRGNAEIGWYQVGGQKHKILLDRSSYPLKPGKPQVFLPQYYDPNTGEFSNVEGPGLLPTDKYAERLQEVVGSTATVNNWSSVGLGRGDQNRPAEVYVEEDVLNLGGTSLKALGIKAGIVEAGPLSVSVVGVQRVQTVDVMTQEVKHGPQESMSIFMGMTPAAQYSFLRRFSPDRERADATIKWMKQRRRQYFGQALHFDDLAIAYNTKGGTEAAGLDGFTANVMFTELGSRIVPYLEANPKEAPTVLRELGIGAPQDQMFQTTVFTKEDMHDHLITVAEQNVKVATELGKPEDVKRALQALKDVENGSLEVPGLVSFKPVPGSKRELYVQSQRILGRGSSLYARTFITAAPEYPSQSGFLNPNSIMSLQEQLPDISRSLGLISLQRIAGKDVEAFTGPNMLGMGVEVDPSRKAQYDFYIWGGHQNQLRMGVKSYPQNTVQLTHDRAIRLKEGLNLANAPGLTAEERLKAFGNWLETGFDKNDVGLDGVDLKDVNFADDNGYLLPSYNTIVGAESFRKHGRRKGESVNFIGSGYLKYFGAVIESATTNPEVNFDRINATAERFFNRVERRYTTKNYERKRGDIYRSIQGVEMPGRYGGRYTGMPGLDAVEMALDDTAIIAMARNRGMIKTAEQARSLIKYLSNGDEDVYLPVLFHRDPDLGSANNWVPVKLRSKRWMQAQGVPTNLTSKMGNNFFMLINRALNQVFNGDYDNDPGSVMMLPFTNEDPNKPGKSTDRWHFVDESAEKEFEKVIGSRTRASVKQALHGMYPGAVQELDVEATKVRDYVKAIFTGQGDIKKAFQWYDQRTGKGKVGYMGAASFLDMFGLYEGAQRGKGASYNRRTLTDDIAATALGFDPLASPGSEQVRQRSFEAGAKSYQRYLDYSPKVLGGLTPLETYMNTLGIYGYGADPSTYRVSAAGTRQGFAPESLINFDPKDPKAFNKLPWRQAGFSESHYNPNDILNDMIYAVADDPEMSDDQIAWGFAEIGKADQVLAALQAGGKKKRSGTLLQLQKSGLVSRNSPYYASAIYKAVSRVQRSDATAFEDQNVKLPWLKGGLMSVSEIAETDEFKSMDLLQKFYVLKNTFVNPEDISLIERTGSPNYRMTKNFLGIFNERNRTAGGQIPIIQSLQALGGAVGDMFKRRTGRIISGSPVVHASELGALGTGWVEPGWNKAKPFISAEANLVATMRLLGLPGIFGDREREAVLFGKKDFTHISEDISSQSDIELGNLFESEYAKEGHGVFHVGQVAPDPFNLINPANLTFQTAEAGHKGLTITGVPDFIGFDEDSGSFVIKDTKLAKADPGKFSIISDRIKSMKNFIQQVGYARGLEKIANSSEGETRFRELLGMWNFAGDNETVSKMYTAAKAGKFQISLIPGTAKEGGGTTTFDEIPIPYNDLTKRRYDQLASRVREQGTFAWQNIKGTASKVLDVLKAGTDYPGTGFTWLGNKVSPNITKILDRYARLSGGSTNAENYDEFIVGEGGPERMRVDKTTGAIMVVPDKHGYRPGFGTPRWADGASMVSHSKPGGIFNRLLWNLGLVKMDIVKDIAERSFKIGGLAATPFTPIDESGGNGFMPLDFDKMDRESAANEARIMASNADTIAFQAGRPGTYSPTPEPEDAFAPSTGSYDKIGIYDDEPAMEEPPAPPPTDVVPTGTGSWPPDYATAPRQDIQTGHFTRMEAYLKKLVGLGSRTGGGGGFPTKVINNSKVFSAYKGALPVAAQVGASAFRLEQATKRVMWQKMTQAGRDSVVPLAQGITAEEAFLAKPFEEARGIALANGATMEAIMKSKELIAPSKEFDVRNSALQTIAGLQRPLENNDARYTEARMAIGDASIQEGGRLIAQTPLDAIAPAAEISGGVKQFLKSDKGMFTVGGDIAQATKEYVNTLVGSSKIIGAHSKAVANAIQPTEQLQKNTELFNANLKKFNGVEIESITKGLAEAKKDFAEVQSVLKNQPNILKPGGDWTTTPTEEERAAAIQGGKLIEKQRELGEGLMSKINPSVSGLNQTVRGFLGGWGLMYMNTLSSYGEEQYSQGYQQNMQSQRARNVAMVRSLGAGTYDADVETKYNNALARGGNIPYIASMEYRAKMASTGLSDISGAVMKGIGAYGLATFAAAQTETTMPNASKFLGKAAPWIMGAEIVGRVASDQYAYYSHPKETGIAAASGYERAYDAYNRGDKFSYLMESAGAAWKTLVYNPVKQSNKPLTYGDLNEAGQRYVGYENVSGVVYDTKAGKNIAAYDLQGVNPAEMSGAKIKGASAWGVYTPGSKELLDLAEKGDLSEDATNRNLRYLRKIDESKGFTGIAKENIPEAVQSWVGANNQGVSDESLYRASLLLGKGDRLTADSANKLAAAYDTGMDVDRTIATMGLVGGKNAFNENSIAAIADFVKDLNKVDSDKINALGSFISKLPDDLATIGKAGDEAAQGLAMIKMATDGKYANVLNTNKESTVGSAQYVLQMNAGSGVNLGNLRSTVSQLMGTPGNATGEQLTALETATSAAADLTQKRNSLSTFMQTRGTSNAMAEAVATGAAGFGWRGLELGNQLLSGNPMAYSRLARTDAGLRSIAGEGVTNLYGGKTNVFGGQFTKADLAVGDTNLAGDVTGRALFSSSWYGMGNTAEQNAALMFGPELMKSATMQASIKGGIVKGYESLGVLGGQDYYRFDSMAKTKEYNQQMQAIQMQNLNMGYAFQTGVGINNYANTINPQTGQAFNFNTGSFSVSVPGAGSFTSQGGGQWGIEDAQRALQNMQAQWQFKFQDKQMALQATQFMENTSLNRKGQVMQRGWQQQAWNYQDETRNLQWGWQQEDYQENARFMTGRDRRLAERNMGRATIMHDLEGEQIDKQRQQQKETWKLEDEQYKLQIRHFKEQEALQKEANKMNKEFYEQNRQLQEQAILLQRAYYIQQQASQQKSTALTMAYNKAMQENNDVMAISGQYAQNATALANLAANALEDFNMELVDMISILTGAAPSVSTPGQGGGGDGNATQANGQAKPISNALGGRLLKGQIANVGDTNELELFSGDESGTIIPLSKMNPWASTMIASEPGASKPQQSSKGHVTIYLGNRYLTDFVVETLNQEVHL